MERETLQEFKRRSRFPADRKKEYNIRNSWGVYDFYKYYRKTKPKDPKFINLLFLMFNTTQYLEE